MKQVLLKGEGIRKAFGQKGDQVKILDGVDVEIYEGDFTVIMGASGAGKSTLLYALSDMDRISGGKVFYKGKDISGYKEDQMARLRAGEFGFVFQQTHLVSNLTLFENVAMAGYVNRNGNPSPKAVSQRAEELLKRMGVGQAGGRLLAQVSGGEAQRAAIARAVINQPGLIFADEPTGALNRGSSREVMGLLAELNEGGQSILMVTHDVNGAIYGNRILYMEDGRILDELNLPEDEREDGRAREAKVNQWLASLRW